MSASHALELSCRGRSKQLVVVAQMPDGPEKQFGRGDIADPEHRTKIAARLLKAFPQLDSNDVETQLDELARLTLPFEAKRASEGGSPMPYFVKDGCTYWRKQTSSEESEVMLANFTATIERELKHDDDGGEPQIHFEIVAIAGGQQVKRDVPAKQFGTMNWVSDFLGARAIVEPGPAIRERFRTAIQKLSQAALESETVYTHTGWRKLDDIGWAYLSAIGPIGPNGPVSGVRVSLPSELARFELTPAADAQGVAASVRVALSIPTVLPPRLGFAILAAAFRAALGATDFSVFFVGRTGVFKSELAALLQQFFGAGFDSKHLPAAWSATPNYLERLGFTAKDAPLVIDDFAPQGSRADVQKYHQAAERVLRAQGNNSARGRLTAEAELRSSKPPRGMFVVTGEDLPAGASLRARNFVLEIGLGEVESSALSTCQQAAAAGDYMRCMAGFVQFVAGRHDTVMNQRIERARELREHSSSDGQHRRTATTVAELMSGFEVFLDFAKSIPDVLSEAQAEELRGQCWCELIGVAQAQSTHQAESDPSRMFIQLLSSAFVSGAAHVQGEDGGPPAGVDPIVFGWRAADGDHVGAKHFTAKGSCVGWIVGNEVWIDGTSAYQAAQSMAGDVERIPISASRLGKHLFESGLLIATESEAGHYAVRRKIGGRRHRVLALALGTFAEAVQSVPADTTVRECASTGPEARPGVDRSPHSSGPADRSTEGSYCGAEGTQTLVGPMGPDGPQFHERGRVAKHTEQPSADSVLEPRSGRPLGGLA